ncbi:hypothetical protein [Paenibacillus sp. BGI2013]|uniref:hypothetical protein n=1 Tax=Paenibacillus sp. BGI2013 TaxID=2058902 RepID=UPI0015D5F481|nr:hypothetical protein [Paenibacillus sp. BGI2013]
MRNSSRLPSARVGKGGKMVLSDQQQGRYTDSSYAKVQLAMEPVFKFGDCILALIGY